MSDYQDLSGPCGSNLNTARSRRHRVLCATEILIRMGY